MKTQRALWLGLLLLWSGMGFCQYANQSVYSLKYKIPARLLRGGTGVLLNPGDLVLLRVTGKATYGPFAASKLGRVDASGSPSQEYRQKWNKERFISENFGALVCWIGDDPAYYAMKRDFRECLTENFSIGACSVDQNPVAGALFVVKNGGELIFDINDQWVLDNDGDFIVDMTVISSSKVIQQQSLFAQGVCQTLSTQDTYQYNYRLMQDIAQGKESSGKLTGLPAFNAYYHFLNGHPAVQKAGIRWQQVAIEVTGLLKTSNAILEEIKRPSWNVNITEVKMVLLVSYLMLTSQYGRNFMQGVASSGLLDDVNRQFYIPLITGSIQVKNPFWFDVAAVYAEQFHPNLQQYYQSFGPGDRLLIEGAFARWFAQRPGCYTPTPEPFQGNLSINNPLDRVKVGLYKMGYSWMQINQAVSVIAAYQNQSLAYNATVSELKQKAIH